MCDVCLYIRNLWILTQKCSTREPETHQEMR